MKIRLNTRDIIVLAFIIVSMALYIFFSIHSHKRFVKANYNQSEWIASNKTYLSWSTKSGTIDSVAVNKGTELTPLAFTSKNNTFYALVDLPTGERGCVDPDLLSTRDNHKIGTDLGIAPIFDDSSNSFVYVNRNLLDDASQEYVESKCGDAKYIYKSGTNDIYFYPQVMLIDNDLVYNGAYITFSEGKVVDVVSLDNAPLDTWLVKVPLLKTLTHVFYPEFGSIYYEKVTDNFSLKWMWGLFRWLIETIFRLFIAFPFLILGVPFLFCYALAYLLIFMSPKATNDALHSRLLILSVVPLYIYGCILALFLQPIWMLSLALSLIVIIIAPGMALGQIDLDRCKKCLKFNVVKVVSTDENYTHRKFIPFSDGENKTSYVKMKKTIYCTENVMCTACKATWSREVIKEEVLVKHYDTVDGFRDCPWWGQYDIKDKYGNPFDPYTLRVAITRPESEISLDAGRSEGSGYVCRLYHSSTNECKHRSIIQYAYCPCKGDLGIHSTCPYK